MRRAIRYLNTARAPRVAVRVICARSRMPSVAVQIRVALPDYKQGFADAIPKIRLQTCPLVRVRCAFCNYLTIRAD